MKREEANTKSHGPLTACAGIPLENTICRYSSCKHHESFIKICTLYSTNVPMFCIVLASVAMTAEYFLHLFCFYQPTFTALQNYPQRSVHVHIPLDMASECKGPFTHHSCMKYNIHLLQGTFTLGVYLNGACGCYHSLNTE